MDQNTERILTDLRIESAAVERQCVNLWHDVKRLLDLVNSDGLPHRGTYVLREPLLEANVKISEAMNLVSSVKDILEMVVPDPLIASIDGDADGVE